MSVGTRTVCSPFSSSATSTSTSFGQDHLIAKLNNWLSTFLRFAAGSAAGCISAPRNNTKITPRSKGVVRRNFTHAKLPSSLRARDWFWSYWLLNSPAKEWFRVTPPSREISAFSRSTTSDFSAHVYQSCFVSCCDFANTHVIPFFDLQKNRNRNVLPETNILIFIIENSWNVLLESF